MIISDEIKAYATGKKFDVGFRMPLQENKFLVRDDFLINLTRGTNIVHVGCCDHLELIDDKVKTGTWLQGRLEKSCEYVLGIDTNEKAINYIKRKNYTNTELLVGDISKDNISLPAAQKGGGNICF